MALDKVKSGNFNMVNIYLEGLTPRIKGHWEKLGKTPEKRKVMLIDDSQMRKELEVAAKEKEKRDEVVREHEVKEEGMADKEKMKQVEKVLKSPEKRGIDTSALSKQKEEIKKEIEKEKSREIETGAAHERGMLEQIDKLEEEIHQLLINKQKKEALLKYAEVQSLYKELPKELKVKVFKKCVDLQKEIGNGNR
jgi:hypothetical protein